MSVNDNAILLRLMGCSCHIVLFLCLLLWSSLDAFAIRAVHSENPCTGDFGGTVSRARYYHPDTGRFWTMDTFEGDQEDPLSLHKYLYCSDEPVNRADPSGKWATFVHKIAARDQLKGLLSDTDVEILCDMQDEVDGKNNQTAAKSFMHAMRDGGVAPVSV